MLIKLRTGGMNIVKTSLNDLEKEFLENYLETLDDKFIRYYDRPDEYILRGSKLALYNVLYRITRDFDIELM